MERMATKADCLGAQNIFKTHENIVVGFVHLLHVHAAVTWLCLVPLLIIYQFRHGSMNAVVPIIPPLWGEKQQQLRRFSVTYVKGLEIGSGSKPLIA